MDMTTTAPRVLQVIPTLDTGGAERTTLDVARAIIGAGGIAVVASQGGRLVPELQNLGAEWIEGPFASKNPVTIWRNVARLAEIARLRDIQVLHARSRAPAWSALWAARRTGLGFVTTYHGIYNARSSIKRLYNSVMARGDLVIANSEYTAEHIRREHGALAKEIAIIPRGTDISAFSTGEVSAGRIALLREAWGLEPGMRVILMPGRLTRWKGQLPFIEAMAQLTSPNTVAVLAGDAQGRDGFANDVDAHIAQHGLKARVRVVGHCADMAAAMALSDVVVSASIEPEAFGRIAVEAQAMERLVVATDLGAARETVLHGQTGLLVPPGDPRAMAAAIDQALALPPHAAAAQGARARTHVLQHFTVEAMTQATLSVYRRVIVAQLARKTHA